MERLSLNKRSFMGFQLAEQVSEFRSKDGIYRRRASETDE
mgnify:FL=1